MNTNVFRLLLLGSLFSLSACVQQSEVRQMKHSVSTLNQEMTQLNKETVKITQQNRLNAKSSSGVYLLPGAKARMCVNVNAIDYVNDRTVKRNIFL